ncbi:22340_t:CDS:2 [Cetraspora pellucida]|uniref:ribonuclease H n=1 Tax=Cetraspora pellucida TaxID=1433469 RepID=A0A9N9J2S1_9GLOM|nr:22340_t:CDS:2 [Cetraspora pellucida]
MPLKYYYVVLISHTPEVYNTLEECDKIVIYTDGSYKNNEKGSYARIGVYYEDRTKQITEPLSEDLQTNNYAKLYAVIRALETCENKLKVIEIKSDSLFVIDSLKT